MKVLITGCRLVPGLICASSVTGDEILLPSQKTHFAICLLRPLLAPTVVVWVFQQADSKTDFGVQDNYLVALLGSVSVDG